MGLLNDINLLQPEFKSKVEQVLKEFDDLGFKYHINETLRTKDVQTAYYAQGREPLITVNRLRKNAGLWEISEEENKNKITWTMKSKHLDGLACDIAPLNPKNESIWWSAPKTIWNVIGVVAKKYDLNWGGDFTTPDYPHIEMK